jgi:hypothetical protein
MFSDSQVVIFSFNVLDSCGTIGFPRNTVLFGLSLCSSDPVWRLRFCDLPPHIFSFGPLIRSSATLPPGGYLSGHVYFQLSETAIIAVLLFKIQNKGAGTLGLKSFFF